MSNYAASANNTKKGGGSMCSSELQSRVEAYKIQLEEERRRRLEVEKQIHALVLERGGPQAAAVSKILNEADLVAQQRQLSSGGGNNNNAAGGSGVSDRASVRSLASGSSGRGSIAGASNNNNNTNTGSQRSFPRNLPPIEQQSQQQQQSNRKQVGFFAAGSNSELRSLSNNTNAAVPQPPARRNTNSLPSAIAAAQAQQQHQQQQSNNYQFDGEDVVAKCESEAAQCERLLRQLNHSHATVLSRKPALPQAARGITRKPGAAGCDYVMARRSKATPAQLYMMNQWHQERVDKINNFTMGVAGQL